MTRIVADRYGKAGIRLVQVTRGPDAHEVADLTVDVLLTGDFAAAYLEGDNRAVLPTDTLRGTVYAFAGDGPVGEPEDFGLRLARHFLAAAPAARTAEVVLTADPWVRLGPHGFRRDGGLRRTARVVAGRDGEQVFGGIRDLVLLKTAGSAFAGFPRDAYTTLAETQDRLMATAVEAEWRYTGGGADHGACAREVPAALAAAFDVNDSRSVQHTMAAMAAAALAARQELDEIRMVLPNRHHLPVDVSAYGREDRGEVFVATDRPYGVIEGAFRR